MIEPMTLTPASPVKRSSGAPTILMHRSKSRHATRAARTVTVCSAESESSISMITVVIEPGPAHLTSPGAMLGASVVGSVVIAPVNGI
jgi:hypothetical protein